MRSVVVALPLLVLLAACGGGGSSPTAPPPPPPPEPPQPVDISGDWSDVTCTFAGFVGEGCVARAVRTAVGATQSFTAEVQQDGEDVEIDLTGLDGTPYRPWVGTVNKNGRVNTTVAVSAADSSDVICNNTLFTIVPTSVTANGDATTETIDLNYFEDGDLLRGHEFYSTYRFRKEFQFRR